MKIYAFVVRDENKKIISAVGVSNGDVSEDCMCSFDKEDLTERVWDLFNENSETDDCYMEKNWGGSIDSYYLSIFTLIEYFKTVGLNSSIETVEVF